MAKKKIADNTSSSGIDKVYFDMKSKESAEELKSDIIASGVPETMVTIRKIKNENLYKLTVDDGQNQIVNIIRMLSSEEYGMDLMEIQKFLGIKITL